jgi:hypothetical protein
VHQSKKIAISQIWDKSAVMMTLVAFSGEVDAGSPQKTRQKQKLYFDVHRACGEER